MPRGAPEILETDLAPLALELAAAGVADPPIWRWLDPPPSAALAEARGLLRQLGALDPAGRITSHGRRLTRFALHPRLAHMVVRAASSGQGKPPASSPRCSASGTSSADRMDTRTPTLASGSSCCVATIVRSDVDGDTLRRVRTEIRNCARAAEGRGQRADGAGLSMGAVLAFAYPDRIGQRRPGASWSLPPSQRRRAPVLEPQASRAGGVPRSGGARWAGRGRAGSFSRRRSRSRRSRPTSPTTSSARMYSHGMRRPRRCRRRRRRRLGAIVLQDGPLPDPDPAAVARAMLEGIRREGVERLPWTDAARRVRARLRFLHRSGPEWPDVSTTP